MFHAGKLRFDDRHNLPELRQSLSCAVSGDKCLLGAAHFLCKSDVFRNLSGKCKSGQFLRVRAIGARLSGRNQLIGRGDRIVDFRDHFHDQIFRQRLHLRPVPDVRTEDEFRVRVRLAVRVKYAVLVNRFVEMIFVNTVSAVDVGGSREESLICCRRRNRARVHQCDRRNLAVLRLAALAVREVARRVTDGKCVVGRCVSCAKTRSAEACLHHCSRLNEFCRTAVPEQLHINRHRCRINAQ